MSSKKWFHFPPAEVGGIITVCAYSERLLGVVYGTCRPYRWFMGTLRRWKDGERGVRCYNDGSAGLVTLKSNALQLLVTFTKK